MRYELSVCPHCLEQVDGGHKHGSIFYCAAYVQADADIPMEDRIRLADAKLEDEKAHLRYMAQFAYTRRKKGADA